MPVSRRHFLATLAAAPVIQAFRRGHELPSGPEPQNGPPFTINAERLREHLEGLSVFGRPSGGTFADGVTRVAYSDADLQGRQHVIGLMKQAGLSPRIDPAGNLIGARAGREPGLPPILFGSHIDSVPNGGNFDGPLGSLAAIEVAQTLAEQHITTRHPLEAVVWVNEEGFAYGSGLDGSRAASGELTPGELDQAWNGVKKADAIRRIGGNPDRLEEARRSPSSIHCYLELHIEQGGSLDRQSVPIGIVEGIVGIDRYQARVRGAANHAGTTPMGDRQDALIAAAQLTLEVREIVTAEPGRQVGTVGQLTVSPNVPNIIPGEVRLTIELRDLSPEKIARLADRVVARSRDIAAATRTTIEISRTSHHEPALAHPQIQQAIEQAALSLGFAALRLPSGAGHDAQVLARIGPMGMIFVPSVGGISHSPKETTRWDDCARGASVLLHTVLAVDRTTVRS
jgi:beta-ureidopropionase / N-carbamoyl-L-amino-acid hydrolase